jgi:hypothetical protein
MCTRTVAGSMCTVSVALKRPQLQVHDVDAARNVTRPRQGVSPQPRTQVFQDAIYFSSPTDQGRRQQRLADLPSVFKIMNDVKQASHDKDVLRIMRNAPRHLQFWQKPNRRLKEEVHLDRLLGHGEHRMVRPLHSPFMFLLNSVNSGLPGPRTT